MYLCNSTFQFTQPGNLKHKPLFWGLAAPRRKLTANLSSLSWKNKYNKKNRTLSAEKRSSRSSSSRQRDRSRKCSSSSSSSKQMLKRNTATLQCQASAALAKLLPSQSLQKNQKQSRRESPQRKAMKMKCTAWNRKMNNCCNRSKPKRTAVTRNNSC